MPETPESRLNHSLNDQSSPEHERKYYRNKYELSLINKLEIPDNDIHMHLEPPGKLVKSKSKNKNILRLNTKSGQIGFKNEPKRKRKSKANYKAKTSTGMDFPLLDHANQFYQDIVKSDANTSKSIAQPMNKIKNEEIKDETAEVRYPPCQCKKSRCLKFYCDCLRAGRMCTPECNCFDC